MLSSIQTGYPSVDKPWQNYYDVDKSKADASYMNIYTYINYNQLAKESFDGTKICIVIDETNIMVSGIRVY